jgi:hypothetical protein
MHRPFLLVRAIVIGLALPVGVLFQGSTLQPAHATVLSMPALYGQAFHQLGRVARFHLQGTATINQTQHNLVHEDLRYVAPNRVALSIQSSAAVNGVVKFDTVQVATTKCQRPPGWLCFHSVAPNPSALASSLITPKISKPRYTTQNRTVTLQGKPQAVTAINIAGDQSGLKYSGTLTITRVSHLPLTFGSTVSRGSTVLARQNIQITYGGNFVIRLPKGKGVHGVTP